MLLREQLTNLDLREQLTIVALLAAMVLSGVIGARLRLGAIVLALLSFAWLTIDSAFEGRVLITVTSHNGLTEADLVAVVGLVVAVVLLVRPRRGLTASSPPSH